MLLLPSGAPPPSGEKQTKRSSTSIRGNNSTWSSYWSSWNLSKRCAIFLRSSTGAVYVTAQHRCSVRINKKTKTPQKTNNQDIYVQYFKVLNSTRYLRTGSRYAIRTLASLNLYKISTNQYQRGRYHQLNMGHQQHF